MKPLAILLLLWPTGEHESCTVTRAVDGDIVESVCGALTVDMRLRCIQAPERGEPGYGAAKEDLAGLMRGHLHATVEDDQDGWNRIVLTPYDPATGETLTGLMVEAGHAKWTRGQYGCDEPRPEARP